MKSSCVYEIKFLGGIMSNFDKVDFKLEKYYIARWYSYKELKEYQNTLDDYSKAISLIKS